MIEYEDDLGYRPVAKGRDLLQRLPKEVRGIGEEVLHAISCGKQLVGWNDKLELTIKQRPIPNTNIVNLIQYILYPETDDEDMVKPPRGFNSFIEALKSIGLESQWVRNDYVIKQLDDNDNEWDTTDSEKSESEEESDHEDVEMDGNDVEKEDSGSSSGDDAMEDGNTATNEEESQESEGDDEDEATREPWKNLSLSIL